MARPTKHGSKWRIRWSDANGVRQSAVFDDYNTAVQELRRRELGAVDLRQRVVAGELAAVPVKKTMNDVFDYWLEHRAPHKRSGDDDKSILRRHLRPAFGALSVAAVNQAHVDAYRDVKANVLGEKTVHNHLTLFLANLQHAHRLGWLAVLPPLQKPKKVKPGGTRFADGVLGGLRADSHRRHARAGCAAAASTSGASAPRRYRHRPGTRGCPEPRRTR